MSGAVNSHWMRSRGFSPPDAAPKPVPPHPRAVSSSIPSTTLRKLGSRSCSLTHQVFQSIKELYLDQYRIEANMRYSTQIKPISYVKSHAAELLDKITEEREPIVITQNGEARAVLIDVHSYEESQETMALLKILAIGEKQVEQGKIYPLSEVIAEIRRRQARRHTT